MEIKLIKTENFKTNWVIEDLKKYDDAVSVFLGALDVQLVTNVAQIENPIYVYIPHDGKQGQIQMSRDAMNDRREIENRDN